MSRDLPVKQQRNASDNVCRWYEIEERDKQRELCKKLGDKNLEGEEEEQNTVVEEPVQEQAIQGQNLYIGNGGIILCSSRYHLKDNIVHLHSVNCTQSGRVFLPFALSSVQLE